MQQKIMRDVFSFIPEALYSFHLMNGDKIKGNISNVFDNGIEVGGVRIPQSMIVYWYEIEEV